MSGSAFEALSELSKYGKKTKVVSVGEVKLTLATLNSEQEGNVFISCSDLNGNAYWYKLKRETLKYSVKAVNEMRLDEYEKVEDKDKREVLKKQTLESIDEIMGNWDENLIDYLYSKWSELSKESEEELSSQGIKK